jgi:hypothetical protein
MNPLNLIPESILNMEWGNLLGRMLVLGTLIFLATTYIPQNPLAMDTRVMITSAVVLVYTFLDVITNGLIGAKNYACDAVCGTAPIMATQPLLPIPQEQGLQTPPELIPPQLP